VLGLALALSGTVAGWAPATVHQTLALELAGVPEEAAPVLASLGLGLALAACLVGASLLDHAGRRCVLLWGTAGSAVCALAFAAATSGVPAGAALLRRDGAMDAARPSDARRRWAAGLLLAMVAQAHIGPVPARVVLACEAFPQDGRARGVALCSAVEQAAQVAAALVFAPAVLRFGVAPVFFAFGCGGLALAAALREAAPETARARAIDLATDAWAKRAAEGFAARLEGHGARVNPIALSTHRAVARSRGGMGAARADGGRGGGDGYEEVVV
jgi:MFS family permease